jgi:hypothetical protein
MLLGLATLLVVLTGAGVAIAGLVHPDLLLEAEPTRDTEALLLYLAARNVGLAIVVVGILLAGAREALTWLATLSGTIQLVDCYVGLQIGNRRRAALAVGLAFVQFCGLVASGLAIPL